MIITGIGKNEWQWNEFLAMNRYMKLSSAIFMNLMKFDKIEIRWDKNAVKQSQSILKRYTIIEIERKSQCMHSWIMHMVPL